MTGYVRDKQLHPDAGTIKLNVPKLYAYLDAHREERGFTWKMLAEQLGCNRHIFSYMKSQGSPPPTHVLVRVMWWMGVRDISLFAKGVPGVGGQVAGPPSEGG